MLENEPNQADLEKQILSYVRLKEDETNSLEELKEAVKESNARIKDYVKEISSLDVMLKATQLKANPHGVNVEVKGSFGDSN